MIEAEIMHDIEKMGYANVISSTVNPSYYQLDDGTILRVLVRLISTLPAKDTPNTFDLQTVNEVTAFVPEKDRRPALGTNNIQLNPQNIVDPDVEYKVLREEFSVYKMDNGVTCSIKTTISQVGKYNQYRTSGEPIYNMGPIPILKIKQTKDFKFKKSSN